MYMPAPLIQGLSLGLYTNWLWIVRGNGEIFRGKIYRKKIDNSASNDISLVIYLLKFNKVSNKLLKKIKEFIVIVK